MKLSLLSLALIPITVACGSPNQGTVTTASSTQPPDVPGTVFTIVFENEDAANVLTPAAPFFYALSQQYGVAQAYTSNNHPSLPNYIMMTSGSTNGVTTDNDPADNASIAGVGNIADQLDAAHVQWRAYMESMGAPCTMASSGLYSAHHDPFLYYADMAGNPTRCNQHVVDFDQNFANDLASGLYRYMWITPNMCDDMHNCDSSAADAALQRIVTQIQAADAYKNGGAIFILFDEGNSRLPGATANLPTLVVSPKLVSAGYKSQTPFDHSSYLATVEDILGLSRLVTTAGSTSMDEFFVRKTSP